MMGHIATDPMLEESQCLLPTFYHLTKVFHYVGDSGSMML